MLGFWGFKGVGVWGCVLDDLCLGCGVMGGVLGGEGGRCRKGG